MTGWTWLGTIRAIDALNVKRRFPGKTVVGGDGKWSAESVQVGTHVLVEIDPSGRVRKVTLAEPQKDPDAHRYRAMKVVSTAWPG